MTGLFYVRSFSSLMIIGMNMPAALDSIQFTQLDATTWCATADILLPVDSNEFTSPKDKRQQQKAGVRLLLEHLLNKLEIIDSLDQTKFPYQLANSRYYVCFSHSRDKVAVALSSRRSVGIDIEARDINWQTAKRYFHADEINILSTLEGEQGQRTINILWQIKESFIKINQSKLASGLGVPYTVILAKIVKVTNTEDSKKPMLMIDIDIESNYKVALLTKQRLVVVL